MLAGVDRPDDESADIPELNVSYKPQKLVGRTEQTVREVFHDKIRDMWVHPQFQTDVARPLKIDDIIDQQVCNLSGGELQRVAITLALGKPADIYLIDEPSFCTQKRRPLWLNTTLSWPHIWPIEWWYSPERLLLPHTAPLPNLWCKE
jgi:translation initiation factor RLI1